MPTAPNDVNTTKIDTAFARQQRPSEQQHFSERDGGNTRGQNGEPFQAGGLSLRFWLTAHINQKEIRFITCNVNFAGLTRTLSDGLKSLWMLAAKRFKSVQPRSVEEFMLSLKWVPTTENEIADAIPRPSSEAIVRLIPAVFKPREAFGPFDIDIMACTASAQISPYLGSHLPFFSGGAYFGCRPPRGSLRECYPRWAMVAYFLDFRTRLTQLLLFHQRVCQG